MYRLNGKVAAVTGASRGIGAAIAKKLAACGADVAIIYRGAAEAAEAVQRTITAEYGVRAACYRCDVADFAQCKETVEKIGAELGVIDILVNNAGITKDALLPVMATEDFDAVINTNLRGCFHMIKACSRGFLKKRAGKIINIASVSGLCGLPGQANYSASKAGIIALTKVTAKELGAKNICCNAIAPGFIMTDMTKDLGNQEEYLRSIPLRRFGNPEDVANLAAFLADASSDYITGEVIRIDGGLAM